MRKHGKMKKQIVIFVLLMTVVLVSQITSTKTYAEENKATTFTVTDEETLRSAVESAPTDGSERVIAVQGEVSIHSPISIPKGSKVKVVPYNGNASITASVGDWSDAADANMLIVSDGASLTISGDSGNTITISGGNGISNEKRSLSSQELGCRPVESAGSVTLKDGAVIQNGGSGKKSLNGCNIMITGGTLTMDGGVVRWGYSRNKGSIYIGAGASFIMNGGEISENGSGYGSGAGVYVDSKGIFTMNAGTISDNHGNSTQSVMQGGGVYTQGLFTMNGGNISNNMAQYGGGVCIGNVGEMKFNGGTISNNSVTQWGGGISVEGEEDGAVAKPGDLFGKLTMNDGTVKDNYAKIAGGGIYLASNDVHLIAGSITGNKSDYLGGGIYVGRPLHDLYIGDSVISENKATVMGGGIWMCPTGNTDISIENSVAVFDNTSSGAGSDVAASRNPDYIKDNGYNPAGFRVSDEMLGFGEANWHQDGGIVLNNRYDTYGHVDYSAERYYPNKNTKKFSNAYDGTPVAIIADPTEQDKETAENAAALFIKNNSAKFGGGIGSNGNVFIQKKQRPLSISIQKKWDGVNAADMPEKIVVEIYRTTAESTTSPVLVGVESIRPDEKGNWKITLENLARTDKDGRKYIYSINEKPISGFRSNVSGDQEQGFFITNTKDNPDKPGGSKPDKPGKTDKVQTGDSRADMTQYAILLLLAGSALAVLLLERRLNDTK